MHDQIEEDFQRSAIVSLLIDLFYAGDSVESMALKTDDEIHSLVVSSSDMIIVMIFIIII